MYVLKFISLSLQLNLLMYELLNKKYQLFGRVSEDIDEILRECFRVERLKWV